MFDKGMTEAFMSLLGQNMSPAAKKELLIRCHFRNNIYNEFASMDLPHRYTSVTNARAAKSVLDGMEHDKVLVVRDGGGQINDDQYYAVTFEICEARG